jgi:hypothetical protein
MTNLNRICKLLDGRGYTMTKEGQILRPDGRVIVGSVTNGGYRKFSFRDKKHKSYAVKFHRFQAYFKYGDKAFEEGVVTRHLDENPANNYWDNIVIGSQSDNMMDIPKEKRILNASNPQHNHQDIIDDHNKGLNYRELMEKYDITSKGTISFIVNKSLASVA